MSNRTHCIPWSDWATHAKVERSHGIRFDTNYYFMGPNSWLRKPGLMTGSGFPQRFADLDGTMIDTYQATTQVSDEANGVLPTTTQIHTLLDNALGSKDYWGVFTVILHADYGDHRRLNDLVSDAQNRGVPVVSSRADARLARRPQRLVLRQHHLQRRAPELLGQHQREGARPAGDAAGTVGHGPAVQAHA